MAELEDRSRSEIETVRQEASTQLQAISQEKQVAEVRIESLERKIRKVSAFLAGSIARFSVDCLFSLFVWQL